MYDLPHVVANQEGAENLEFLAGDMFHSVPRANAILLKVTKDILSLNSDFL